MKEKLQAVMAGALAVKFASAICKKCKLKVALKIQKEGIEKANDNIHDTLCSECIDKVRRLTEKHATKIKKLGL